MTSRRVKELEIQLASTSQGVDEIDLLNSLAFELVLEDIDRADTLAQRTLQLSRAVSMDGQAYEIGLAVIMLDIDHFKWVND